MLSEVQNKLYGGGLSPYSPGSMDAAMQYRVPPLSVSPNKCPSPMDYNDNSYGTAQYQCSPATMNIHHSPSHDQTIDTFQSNQPNLQIPNQWNIPIKPDPSLFQTQQQWNMPQTSQFQEQNWNGFTVPANVGAIPESSVPDTNVVMGSMNNLDDPPGLSSVLDLDSQELQQLNSADLADGLSVFDNQLSENLTNNLNIIDSNIPDTQQNNNENMTDSFTRIANSTINEICNLGKNEQM